MKNLEYTIDSLNESIQGLIRISERQQKSIVTLNKRLEALKAKVDANISSAS